MIDRDYEELMKEEWLHDTFLGGTIELGYYPGTTDLIAVHTREDTNHKYVLHKIEDGIGVPGIFYGKHMWSAARIWYNNRDELRKKDKERAQEDQRKVFRKEVETQLRRKGKQEFFGG